MYREAKMQIDSNDLRISDKVAIRTRNNLYTFLVIDPVKSFGFVVGGAAGPKATECLLVSIESLKVGSKARIMLHKSKGSRVITTSRIVTLELLRSDEES